MPSKAEAAEVKRGRSELGSWWMILCLTRCRLYGNEGSSCVKNEGSSVKKEQDYHSKLVQSAGGGHYIVGQTLCLRFYVFSLPRTYTIARGEF